VWAGGTLAPSFQPTGMVQGPSGVAGLRGRGRAFAICHFGRPVVVASRLIVESWLESRIGETECGRAHVGIGAPALLIQIARDPATVQGFSSFTCHVAPGKGIEHQVAWLRQEVDKEARQADREARWMRLQLPLFQLLLIFA